MSQLKHSRIPSTKGHIWFKAIGCCYLQNSHTRTNSLWVTAVFWSCISNSVWFQSLLSSPPLTPPTKTCCATTDKRNSLYYLWVKWIQHHYLNRCQFTCDCTNKAEKQRSIVNGRHLDRQQGSTDTALGNRKAIWDQAVIRWTSVPDDR